MSLYEIRLEKMKSGADGALMVNEVHPVLVAAQVHGWHRWEFLPWVKPTRGVPLLLYSTDRSFETRMHPARA
jgi:hypothetical protein